jgi:hypothetical protein
MLQVNLKNFGDVSFVILKNNELNYEELNITSYRKTETENFDKHRFLYNVDDEFCCIARM